MRRLVVAIMTAGVIALTACSNKTEQQDDSGQKVTAGIRKAAESGVIRTEGELESLLVSIKPGETKKSVALVGLLDVGAFSSIKADPSKLTIGNTSVIVMMDHSDKDEYIRQASKYDRKTVLLKADINKTDPMKDSEFVGPLIVNVQHIENVEQP
jgi:hypothetical protein